MFRTFVLGIVYLTPITANADAVAELTAKADKGDAEAMFQLGRLYADGKDVKKDEAEALKWYQKAAARDHTKAEVQIGSFYAHGFGVKQDWAESIKWYRKSALKGDTTAQHNLGLDYLGGHGVEKDAEMAALWFKLAADQGHARAQFNLSELYEKGMGVKKDERATTVYCNLAARHDDLNRIFGEEKARTVLETRDRYQKLLSKSEAVELKEMVANAEAVIAVHPRRFGSPGGVGPTRGWYYWRKYDPKSGEAELAHEATGEVFETWVVPWGSTYRYLNYGCSPEALLRGERINAFFSPDEKHKRGFLVHFQDEIGQMKGHGHFWQVKAVAKDGKIFTAIAMAGDKPLEGKELKFQINAKCRILRNGKACDMFPYIEGSKLYMTWCLEKEERVAKFVCDDASLEVVKKVEAERLGKEIKRDGMLGWVESWNGKQIHLLIFARHWSQASALMSPMPITLKAPADDLKPKGEAIDATVTFTKNRGAYGSGVTDMVVELANPEDLTRIKSLPGFRYVLVFAR